MIVNWANGVNTKILRNGTNWANVQRFIADTTRSGKTKRRMANSCEKQPFQVQMRFSYDEYILFDDWFNDVTLGGLYPFYFSKIDEEGHETIVVYQFADGGTPQYSNGSGDNVDVTMTWEKV